MNDCQDSAVRLVLVGKTGSGKSATANTILGEKKFISKLSGSSITTECQKAFMEWQGKKILVVDTPGLFDTKESLDTTCTEISKCVLFSAPGPHAIIMVLQLNRYTEEEQKTFAIIKALFGESVTKHMIIVFTRKEDLEGKALSEFLAEADVSLKNMVKECGNRCCAFANKTENTAEKEDQMKELMQLIERMMHNNAHFSDNIYKNVEQKLKQKSDMLVQIFDAQLEKEIQLIEEEYADKPQKEKEEKIKILKDQHAIRIKNIREEAEKNIFTDISKMIHSFFSKIMVLFGK